MLNMRLVTVCTVVVTGVALAAGVRQWRVEAARAADRTTVAQTVAASSFAGLRLRPVGRTSSPESPPGRVMGTCGPDASPCQRAAEAERHTSLAAPSLHPVGMTALLAAVGIFEAEQNVMLVLFSPSDCSLCLQESVVWNEVAHGIRGAGQAPVKVVGIADHTTVDEMATAVRQLGLTFPVFVDEAGTLRALFHFDDTPVKVLVGRGGKIVMMDGPHQSEAAQRALLSRVTAALGEVRE